MQLLRPRRSAAAAAFVIGAALAAAGCAALRDSRPSWPVKEYEKLIAGRLDADYVGTAACVAKCHTHDTLARDFRLSVHGEQTAAESGMPLVNCESCHGPGSLAIENIQDGRCDFSTFIPIREIPAGAQSLICLKCHAGQSLSNLTYWPSSPHASRGLGCPDCHQMHQGPRQKVARRDVAALCVGCHRDKAAAFSLPSHHPVQEGIMSCVDCHDPHGTSHEAQLTTFPERTLCVRCHAEKTGPFVFEHANLMADCETCHDPHGSTNRQMLRWAQPFLCLQCHGGHNAPRRPVLTVGDPATKAAFFTDCTTCHPRIHGTDLPGYRNDDRFTR